MTLENPVAFLCCAASSPQITSRNELPLCYKQGFCLYLVQSVLKQTLCIVERFCERAGELSVFGADDESFGYFLNKAVNV